MFPFSKTYQKRPKDIPGFQEMNLFQKHRFTAKFVLSRCDFCKLQGILGFSFPKIILVKAGLMPAIHNVTCSPSLAENDFRLLKNSEGNRDGEWIFCRRKEADVVLFLQVTRMRKIIKICEANLTSRLLPLTGRSQSNEP